MSSPPADHISIMDGGTLITLCCVKLYRCCGEGPLVCEREKGHTAPHTAEGICW